MCPMNLNPLNVRLDAARRQTIENARPFDCCTTQQFNANRHTRSFHLGEKESFAKIAFSIYADKQLSRVMAPNDFRISFKCFPCERFCLLLMAQVASTTKHDDTFARFSLFLFFLVFSRVLTSCSCSYSVACCRIRCFFPNNFAQHNQFNATRVAFNGQQNRK